MLGLILATLSQLPSPAEEILDPRPVLTQLSLCHFPTTDEEQAQTRLLQGGSTKQSREAAARRLAIPSLVDQLVHYCRMHPDAVGLWQHQEELKLKRPHVWTNIEHNHPFYHHYTIDIPGSRRRNMAHVTPGPRTMYLCAATIVVVPDNLFHQWTGKITKHCHDTLRVLEVTNEKLPCAKELVSSYDVSSSPRYDAGSHACRSS